MLTFRSAPSRKKLLTAIGKQWRIAAVLFGLVLTVVWLALLAWGALQLFKLV
jgi:membrane-anchored glycerophosphoryl diester phosphodiesterase (GDPDase)